MILSVIIAKLLKLFTVVTNSLPDEIAVNSTMS